MHVHLPTASDEDDWEHWDDLEIEDSESLPPRLTHSFLRKELPDGSRFIALITTDGSRYGSVALAENLGASGHYQDRMRFSHVTAFESVKFSQVHDHLPQNVKRYFPVQTLPPVVAFPPRTGELILGAVIKKSPKAWQAITTILALLQRRRIPVFSGAYATMAQEKDAFDTARVLAGLGVQPLGGVWNSALGASPIMDLLGDKALEDRELEHDVAFFGGLSAIGGDVRGARRYYDDRSRSIVTIVNVNRTRLENTSGVDLIVHFERYNLHLFVQYKRLLKEGDSPEAQWRFRPSSDKNYASEMGRIMRLRPNALKLRAKSALDYRLSHDPFYFKFCRADVFTPDATSMVRGVYVPAADLDHFISSDAALGKRGGAYFGYDNFPMRFPNHLFLQLARYGWIGARGLTAKSVAKIVGHSLASAKSVMLANIPHHEAVDESPDGDEPDLVHDAAF